jgi:hypothetical protein
LEKEGFTLLTDHGGEVAATAQLTVMVLLRPAKDPTAVTFHAAPEIMKPTVFLPEVSVFVTKREGSLGFR